MLYSSRKPIIVLSSIQALLYSQVNSILHILKMNDVSQTLKCHFIIDEYLLVLIPGSFKSILH